MEQSNKSPIEWRALFASAIDLLQRGVVSGSAARDLCDSCDVMLKDRQYLKALEWEEVRAARHRLYTWRLNALGKERVLPGIPTTQVP